MNFFSDIFDYLFARISKWWLCIYGVLAVAISGITTFANWVLQWNIRMLNGLTSSFSGVTTDWTTGTLADCWASDFAKFVNYFFPLAETVTAIVFVVGLMMVCACIRIVKAWIPTESG